MTLALSLIQLPFPSCLISYTHIESITFTPGGSLTKSHVCFAFNVSISTLIGTIHLSGSVLMACWYDWGMLCDAFVLVKRDIMKLSYSLGDKSTVNEVRGHSWSAAQSLPLSFSMASHRLYSADWSLALEGWDTQVLQCGSVGTMCRLLSWSTVWSRFWLTTVWSGRSGTQVDLASVNRVSAMHQENGLRP